MTAVRMRQFVGLVAALLPGVLLAAAGCAGPSSETTEEQTRSSAKPPEARAFVVEDDSRLPSGPGAEGRTGDIVLQNERVRFVVAGRDRDSRPVGYTGHLLDAVVRGKKDRMRLLAACAGGEERARYSEVKVESSGGRQGALVVARGRCAGRDELRVRTRYRLKPGSRTLLMTTRVTNRSSECRRDVRMDDRLYPGRAVRFAEGLGLFPTAQTGGMDWLSFFAGS